MHASNPSNCNADETNVRLGHIWLGEVFKAAADWLLASAAPFSDLT